MTTPEFTNLLTTSNPTQQSFRQAGKLKGGNLQKGFIQNAVLKTSVSSIPSKFETIIYKGNTSKAFGTSAIRFHISADNENPAPGQYSEQNSIISSYSKKGYTTGFTSNQPRTTFHSRYLNTGPGPCSYQNSSSDKFSQSSIVWSTSNKGSAMFQSIGRNIENKNKEIIGPGHYNPQENPFKGANPYHSAFNSRTNRDKYLQKAGTTPDPGAYEISKNVIKPLGYKHFANSSNFCNAVEVKKQANQVKGLMKYLGEEKNVKGTPGPGSYFQREGEDRIEDEQAIDQFSKTEKDRFFRYLNINTKQNNFPGPAHYNILQQTQLAQIAEEKQLVSGAVFMSESIRRPFGDFDKKMGPNNGIAQAQPKKKSFHLNLAKKWV